MYVPDDSWGGKIRQTAVWLWGVIRNPDIVWVDTETKEESREHWKRSARFSILRPMWTHYFLTTNLGCGCRKRFGLWYTMWCSDHASEMADEKWDDEIGTDGLTDQERTALADEYERDMNNESEA